MSYIHAALFLPLAALDRNILRSEGGRWPLGPTPWYLGSTRQGQPRFAAVDSLRKALTSADTLRHWGVGGTVGGGGHGVPPTRPADEVPPSLDTVTDGHWVVVLGQGQDHLEGPLQTPPP